MRIKLDKGLFAEIDEADSESILQHRWHAKFRANGTWYAYTNIKNGKHWSDGHTYTSMHRFILSPPLDVVIDHIDGNGLNNVRNNLRMCSQSENMKNRKGHGVSKFLGVTFDPSAGSWRKPWRACIFSSGHRTDLGRFASEIDAALAYDEAAKKLHGEFARPNFRYVGANAGTAAK